jgi:uncharacterized protein YcbX
MPAIARFNVTPVKGTRLLHPDRVELTSEGIPGNRRFFLVDEDGELYSGSDFGPLVRVHASTQGARLTCAFPDGSTLEAEPELDEQLVVDFYGRAVSGRVVSGGFGEAFSSFVGRPLRLVRAEADGDGPDVRRLSLVSLASVRELAGRGGHQGDLDPGRFRINVEIDGCAPFEEDTWDGRRVRLGEAVVRLWGQIPRCDVTTKSPETGEKDFETLKVLAGFRPLMDRDGAGGRGIPFGMYAEVEEPATVAIGDLVAPD